MTKREFLTASVGAGFALGQGRAALAQGSVAPPRTGGKASGKNEKIPTRMAKTTKLFKAPKGFPNGIAVAPEGLWIAEQKLSGAQATSYHMAEPKDLTEAAWLV